MPDTDAQPTLLDRMLAAGIPEERAQRWLEAGAVMVAGERVSDPATVMPAGASWVVNPQ